MRVIKYMGMSMHMVVELQKMNSRLIPLKNRYAYSKLYGGKSVGIYLQGTVQNDLNNELAKVDPKDELK